MDGTWRMLGGIFMWFIQLSSLNVVGMHELMS